MPGWKTIRQDEEDDQMVLAVGHREREIHSYQTNEANYQDILDTKEMKDLPAEWPEHLKKFRKMKPQEIVEECDPAELDLVTDLQFRDQIRTLLQTERIQRKKSEAVHSALSKKAPTGYRWDNALNRMRQQGKL